MKKTVKLIAFLLTAVMFTTVLTSCGGSSNTSGQTSSSGSSASSGQTGSNTSGSSASGSSGSASNNYQDVTGVDFSKPEIVIAYEDFDGMKDLAKKMQNFEVKEGTVVEIDGEVGSTTMSHTIVVPNTDGSQRIGTTYEVVGIKDSDIPADKTRIHIKGVVRKNGDNINVLVVPADQFKVAG